MLYSTVKQESTGDGIIEPVIGFRVFIYAKSLFLH